MSYFTQVLKNENKKAFVTIVAAGLLSMVAVAGVVSADGPQFNIFPISYTGELNHDLALLDARNISNGEGWSTSQTDHNVGVNADPGDIIEFSVYYHNGAVTKPENIANNTLIRATKSGSASLEHTIGASIGASNASTVFSSSAGRGGDMQVHIAGTVAQTLELVPGSTVLRANRGLTSPPSPQTLSDSIFGTGVNIGDVQACWDFQGLVNFKVKVSQVQPQITVNIDKQVKNVTDNTSYTDMVNADPDDVVEFKITGTNTSSVTIDKFTFSDNLPNRLSFVSGSLIVSRSFSGGLFNGGLIVNSISPGQSVTIEFKARVAPEAEFSFGTTNLTNVAFLTGTGPGSAGPVQDTAIVKVTRQQPLECTIFVRALFNGAPFSGALSYTISGNESIFGSFVPEDHTGVTSGTYSATRVSGGPTGANYNGVQPTSGFCPANGSLTFTFLFTTPEVPNFTIEKTVRNINQGTGFVEGVSAAPSDVVEFQIVIRNTGNVNLTNVIGRDVLPTKLTFKTGTMLIDGANAGCDSCYFGTTGVNLGTLVPNQAKTVIFRADVASQSQFTVGTTSLVNTAYAKASTLSEKQDTASVFVTKVEIQKEDGNGGSRPQ